MKTQYHGIANILLVTLLAGCAGTRGLTEAELNQPAPETPREFRAAWVATVANIDWPSQPGLSAADQQSELRLILDRAVALNLNAIILQVRPAADALYVSAYEPWSEYLTGAQGTPPFTFYDPLEFAVEEAHRRGLELHAWFNPYRARHRTASTPAHPKHVSRTHPEAVLQYGEQQWIDPGSEAGREYVLEVILDVVRRYDIDGIHLDDYFYPYAISDSAGVEIPFPDTVTFAAARALNPDQSLNDWRRNNVDTLVEELYQRVKQAKSNVKVGISPFGIWRPGYPEQIEGFDAYDRIFADARKWFHNGWVDYLTPQLYWSIEKPEQSYPVLLDWWNEQNLASRHLWPGNYTSRVIAQNNTIWEPEEILSQIAVTRGVPGAEGNVHFSMKALMSHPTGMGRALADQAYATQALVPDTPWLNSVPPAQPSAIWDDLSGRHRLLLVPGSGTDPRLWVVKTRYRSGWQTRIVPGWIRALDLGVNGEEPARVVVTAVSGLGAESPEFSLRGRAYALSEAD